MKILIKGMEGIGDQIYQRPFIKHLAKENDIYISTFLPELYKDLDVKIVDPMIHNHRKTTYRTQLQQFNKTEFSGYSALPKKIGRELNIHYGHADILHHSIVSNFFKQFAIPFSQKIEWSLPSYEEEYLKKSTKISIPNDRKIAIVRPPTVRKEWEVHTRNPHPNYIAFCARVLQEYGYYVISIANLADKEEWICDFKDPPADLYLHKGELGLLGTLELIKRSSIVVSGPCFVTPASVSTGTPLFTIFGGRMAYDTPYKLFHNSMDLKKLGWAVPDNPCMCIQDKHNCDKKITTLETDFLNFIMRI